MSGRAQHRTVLLEEAVDALAVKPDGVYVDATFGRGGHSRLILERLNGQGRLIALDRDPAAVEAGRQIADPRLKVIHAAFSDLRAVLEAEAVERVDGVLLDLGVSSPQLDEAQRGFSFRLDAPLDMRMDTSRGQTAAEWLAQASRQQLAEVIKNYGEERFANAVAKAIVAARAGGLSQPHDNLPRSWHRPSARASKASIRRRAAFRLYGFTSIRSLRNCR